MRERQSEGEGGEEEKSTVLLLILDQLINNSMTGNHTQQLNLINQINEDC